MPFFIFIFIFLIHRLFFFINRKMYFAYVCVSLNTYARYCGILDSTFTIFIEDRKNLFYRLQKMYVKNNIYSSTGEIQ